MKKIFLDDLVEVILFGSYATGKQVERSDIDVMILV
jgi:predicted nucleotidyltransferase